MRRLLPLLLAAAGLLAALAPTVLADVLVTRDGERVETRGPWEVKGRLVVFTTPDGQLASLRAADVDLEASRQATGDAARPRQEEPAQSDEEPRRRSSGRRITNADIGPGQPAPPPAEEEEADSGAEAEEGSQRGEVRRELATLGIERATAPEDGHAVIRGTLRNTAAEPAVGVSLTIHLHGHDGEPLESAEARLGARALKAGEETSFVADFPDVFSYASMRLVPRATFLATTADEEPAAEEGEAGPSDAS